MKKTISVIKQRFKDLSIQKRLILTYVLLILFFLSVTSIAIWIVLTHNLRDKTLYRIEELNSSLMTRNVNMLINEFTVYSDLLMLSDSVQSLLTITDEGQSQNFVLHSINAKQESSYYSTILNKKINVELYNSNNEYIQTGATEPLLTSQEIADFKNNNIDEIFDVQTIERNGVEETYVLYMRDARSIISGFDIGTLVVYQKESDVRNVYFADSELGNISYITNNQGVILSSTEPEVIGKSASEVFDNGGLFDGKNYLQMIENLDSSGLSIVNLVPADYYIDDVFDLQAVIVIVCSVCALVAIYFAILLAGTISRPILALLDTTKSIRTGKSGARVQISSKDEIGGLSMSFNAMLDTIDKLIENISIEQQNKKDLEIRLIQSQIRPHFLYNILGNISSFIKIKKTQNALLMIDNLADFYRNSLSNGEHIISMDREIAIISSYLNIQSLRYSPHLIYEINVEEGLENFAIPKLTLQPLVENAIYHGIKESPSGGKVKVDVYLQDENIVLEVWDNGVGMSEEKLNRLRKDINVPDSEGFGLASVQQRIRLMHGVKYGVGIESIENEFTCFKVTIPPIELR